MKVGISKEIHKIWKLYKILLNNLLVKKSEGKLGSMKKIHKNKATSQNVKICQGSPEVLVPSTIYLLYKKKNCKSGT